MIAQALARLPLDHEIVIGRHAEPCGDCAHLRAAIVRRAPLAGWPSQRALDEAKGVPEADRAPEGVSAGLYAWDDVRVFTVTAAVDEGPVLELRLVAAINGWFPLEVEA